jgi:hypothetical protein
MEELVAYYNRTYASILRMRVPLFQKRRLVIQLNHFILPKVRSVKMASGTPSKRAVLIGTNYPGTIYELRGCDNDVHALKAFFEARAYKVTTLCDDTVPPTKDNILRAITKVLTEVDPGSSVVLTFSCHGSYQPGPLEVEQLVIPLDFRPITDVELKSVMRANLKKGVKVFALFDSCYSGTALNLRYNYMQTDKQPNVDTTKDETVSQVVALSGCTYQQTSADAMFGNVANGALTKAFLAAPRSCFRDLVLSVRNFMVKNGFTQRPQLESGTPLDLTSFPDF